MPKGRPKGLTEVERGLLHAGLVASLRSRENRFWAYDVQKVFEDIMRRRLSWGTMLPALRRLEAMGLLAAEWDTPDPSKRPIRYYTLTEAGKTKAGTSTAAQASAAVTNVQMKRGTI